MFSLSSQGHSRRQSLAGISQSYILPVPSADSTWISFRSDASSPASRNQQSTHARRRSEAITRDLFAGGSRDAVRCKASGMDGLEELLAMEPPPPAQRCRASEQLPASQSAVQAFCRPSWPAHLFAWPATAPTPLPAVSSLSSASPSSALSSDDGPRRFTAAYGLRDPSAAQTDASALRSKLVKRKPVPALAQEDEVETVADPCWDGSVKLQLVSEQTASRAEREQSSDDESVILDRVRKMSVKDGGLRIGLPRIGTSLEVPGMSSALFPSPPLASPISSICTSTTASLESTESSASSVPSASASSSSRPFALVKQQHAKPTTAHNVIFDSTRPWRQEDLLDAWMDLIVGDEAASQGSLPFGRAKRPDPSSRPSGSSISTASLASVSSLSAPTPRPPPASFAPAVPSVAPPQLSPDALAELASSLPPLMYATPVSPAAPVPPSFVAPPSPPLSTSGADSKDGSVGSLTTRGVGGPVEAGFVAAAAPSRLSMLADDDADDAQSDGTHGTSDAFYDAVEELEVLAAPYEALVLTAQSLPRKRPVLEIASSSAIPLASPTSPTHPEPKRRLVLSSDRLDKPLPPRPPKILRRRDTLTLTSQTPTMAIRARFENSSDVSVFASLTYSYCLAVVSTGSSDFYSTFEAELPDVGPVAQTSIGGTRTIGRLVAGSRHGLLVPNYTTARQLRHLPNSLPRTVAIQRNKERLSALGNSFGAGMIVNDWTAFTSLDTTVTEISVIESARRTVLSTMRGQAAGAVEIGRL